MVLCCLPMASISDIETAFEKSSHPALHNLTVSEQDDGGVLIEGIVSSEYLRRLAYDVAKAAAGTLKILNDIQVVERE